jgi:nitrous oxide reductase
VLIDVGAAGFPLSRREILKSTTAFIAAAGAVSTAAAQPFGAATTIVNIHSGQPDQKKVIEFYASSVLPKLGTRS